MKDADNPFPPYNYAARATCEDCGERFLVHENLLTEVRCIPCQSRFRTGKYPNDDTLLGDLADVHEDLEDLRRQQQDMLERGG